MNTAHKPKMLCYVTFCRQSYYNHNIEEEMERVCSMPEGEEHAYRTLAGKPEGKKALKKPRCQLKDNI